MEIFTFLKKRWSICKAKEIIKAKKKKTMAFEVNSVSCILPFIHINEEHALSSEINLDSPCIMIECDSKGGIEHMFIDGWHRIWRAKHEGKEILRTYLLSSKEAEECEL